MTPIKDLLRKHLLRHLLLEADPQGHFKDRVWERVYGIKEVRIPQHLYRTDQPKDKQNEYIIDQITRAITRKIAAVTSKTYPSKGGPKTGICVLVPLGKIIVKTPKGEGGVVIMAEAQSIGTSYYITIYDNRMPTIVLADTKIPANKSPETQLAAHINNTIENGWAVNKKESYIDDSFNDTIVITL